MKLAFCWITTLAVAQLCAPLRATDTKEDRKTLVGMKFVNVLVEDLPPGAAVVGLTRESIQTDAELKLRLVGMLVFAIGPVLYIHINLTDDARAGSVGVELQQPVGLLSDPTIQTIAPTWSVGVVISNPTAQGIRNYIKDLIDKFLNAWLSVNPKR